MIEVRIFIERIAETITKPSMSEIFVNVLDFVKAGLTVTSAAISLILVIKGVAVIKELKLRSYDALFGFHSKLNAHLKLLVAEMGSGKSKLDSPFYYLAHRVTKDEENTVYKLDQMINFVSHVDKTMSLFTELDGQMPLSKTMYDNFNILYQYLLNFHYWKSTSSYRESDILTEHWLMKHTIMEICSDINTFFPRFLYKYWGELDRLSSVERSYLEDISIAQNDAEFLITEITKLLNKNEAAKIKSLFSKKAIYMAKDLDECVRYLNNFVKRDLTDWMELASDVKITTKFGRKTIESKHFYTVSSHEDQYLIFLLTYPKAKKVKNKSLYYLKINKLVDDTTYVSINQNKTCIGIYKPMQSDTKN